MGHRAEKVEQLTGRLVIRTPDEKDIKDIYALMSDLEIAENTGFQPMSTLSEAEGKIRRGIEKQQMFSILEKEHLEHIIGIFEIAQHKTNTVSGEKCNYEICYFLHKESRKKGYMTEVVEAMKDYLFNERKADSLTIAVLPGNDASRRVALKNGFTYTGMEKGCGLNCHNVLVDLEYYTVCCRFEEYREVTQATSGVKNYAVFSAHDELIGDTASLDNMSMVFDTGYSILIDAKGGHRLRKTTLKLLRKYI